MTLTKPALDRKVFGAQGLLPPDHALRFIGLPALVGAHCQVNNSKWGNG